MYQVRPARDPLPPAWSSQGLRFQGHRTSSVEELARAPRLGAALTTNGEQSEEELFQVGKLYGRR